MNTAYKILISILFLLIAGLIGFLIGKYCFQPKPEVNTVTVTKYLKGEPIEVIKEKPVPYAVYDTVIEPVDTAQLFAIWEDYHLKRQYKLDFSNDTIGTFVVDATVNENKLVKSEAKIQPIKQVITKTEKVNKVTFIRGYAGLGTSVHNFNTQKITFGAQFVERFNVGITAMRHNSDFTYTVDFGIMFP